MCNAPDSPTPALDLRSRTGRVAISGGAWSGECTPPSRQKAGPRPSHSPGKVVGIYFRTTSTRTRTAFSVGALRLGARIVTFGPSDLQENTGETSEDTARVLSSMLDVLVARTAGEQDEFSGWARQSRMSVVNAMSATEHPTQALTDLTTMLMHFGRIEDLRVLYIGEGNNTAAALGLGLSRFRGAELHLVTPPGYGLDPTVREIACQQAEQAGATVVESHDMASPPSGVDVVYTTRWQTTGTSKPDADWRSMFAPYRIDDALLARHPNAIVMHDLPAHRGDEITAAVLDGPSSLAFRQAESRFSRSKHSTRRVR